MMDRNDIVLREADASNSPDLLKDLVRAVDDMFTPAVDGAGKWLIGKGEAEIAKAAEIKSRVLTAIASIDHERQKLLQDREHAEAALKLERERDRMGHEERMYNLQTERLKAQAECVKAVVESLRYLREIGVEVSLEHVRSMLEPPLAGKSSPPRKSRQRGGPERPPG